MSLMPSIKLTSRIVQSNLRELALPYRLTYAVTNRCQARCNMCNIWRTTAHDELTFDEIDALFSKTHHFSWINLTGGELFQRPDINEIFLSIIKRSRNLFLLNFPTNGLQTGDVVKVVDIILRQTNLPRLIVSVSLDGPPELHDNIRGIPGCWDHAIETFRQLRNRRSGHFSVYFGHTVQAANLGRFDETLRASDRALGNVSADDFHINLAHTSDHYYDNTGTETIPEPEHAVLEIERIRQKQSSRPLDPVAFIEQRYQHHVRDYLSTGRGPYVCQAAGGSCFIDPSGTVYPCTIFDKQLGSLRDFGMDLRKLWREATRENIRDMIKRDQCPGCWTPCEAYQTLLANLLRKKRQL